MGRKNTVPKNPNIKKVLVFGSGPIEIGQAAEFDYAGTQACKALREEGVTQVLLNSNPATIMTDPQMADCVYIEPMTVDVVEKIIRREKPDGILATMGGQTALNLAVQLEQQGVLRKYKLSLLGTNTDTISCAEDRSGFRELMFQLQQPVPSSCIVEDLEQAYAFVDKVGLPVVVRPAYTLGGSGSGLAATMEELQKYVRSGLRQSPIGQVLLEQSIAGLTEIEFEVIRDSQGTAIIVCDMENIDPVGIHTGDSMVVAPCQTLNLEQKQRLEQAALKIVDALGVVGSCNVQFAFNHRTNEYYVIEVNPRVSRSSALASKATGYPIARIAAKIALGFTLQELHADQRPMLDYVVIKIPRWPFDKFPHANRQLGTQMKATGEVMAIGKTLAEAWQKAVRSLELETDSMFRAGDRTIAEPTLRERLQHPDDERLFLLIEALQRGYTVESLSQLTKIHPYFLSTLEQLVVFRTHMQQQAALDAATLKKAKQLGFSDADIARCYNTDWQVVANLRRDWQIRPVYAQIEWGSDPYYYSTYHEVSDPSFSVSTDNAIKHNASVEQKQGVVVLGSGPIRIGQGIEFDYATVHAAWALQQRGYQAIIINNNPETVSTDSTTSDRLYFEPLTPEDVIEVIAHEHPCGVMVQFGGQTAINLTAYLAQQQIPILGTSALSIAQMEDRRQFDNMLAELNILRPQGITAANREEALSFADNLTYPVVVRPSYVLGGRGMEVIHNRAELEIYLQTFSSTHGYPLLIDRYVSGIELEVDAVSDGEDIFFPGVMEHLERAGVHSGDSIAVFPAQSVDEAMIQQIYACTKLLARCFQVKGLLNIQFVLADQQLYVLEVNPRSSRTVPFLSKATGIPIAQLATRAALGESLARQGYTGIYTARHSLISVKVPVFSFKKLQGVEIALGPEMKSTGEAMGRDRHLAKALYKGFIASSIQFPQSGKALLTVADKDKPEIIPIARKMRELGMELYATAGTAQALLENDIQCQVVTKLHQSREILYLIESQQLDLVVNTYTIGKQPQRDGFRIRMAANENGVLCFTALDTVRAYLNVMEDQLLWLSPLAAKEVE